MIKSSRGRIWSIPAWSSFYRDTYVSPIAANIGRFGTCGTHWDWEHHAPSWLEHSEGGGWPHRELRLRDTLAGLRADDPGAGSVV